MSDIVSLGKIGPLPTVRSLPYDAEVEYLESTGTQYIKTGTTRLASDVVRIGFSATQFAFVWAFGVAAWEGAGDFGIRFSGSGTTGSCFNGWTVQNASLNAVNVMNSVTFTSASVIVNGTAYAKVASDIGHEIYLFATNLKNARTMPSKIRLYSYSVERDGKLVFNILPVRFTNELGVSEGAMYDKATGTLFRNANTAAGAAPFLFGPDK